jgi:DNA modification methylase
MSGDIINEARVASLLASHTYEEVREITSLSRGTIYRIALKLGARKHETRIQQRREQRRREQQAFLQSMIDQTAKADVLDFLSGLPDDSLAAHISSPPYNLGKAYGSGPSADTMRYTYFHGWLMQIVSEMARTVKHGGVVCLNTGKTRDWTDHLLPMDIMLFEDLRRAGLTFQTRIVWTIPHGLTPANRPADRYETILVFSKGEPRFNATPARIPQKQPGKRAFKGPNKGNLSGNPYGAAPTDVWNDIPNVGHNHPERAMGSHPAQFPVALAKRLVLLYTQAGDTVCDVFSGSGSTAVAAIETGRHFTGADLFYEELRAKRIANAKLDSVTPLPGVTDESLAIWQAEARRVDMQAKPVTAAQEAAQQREFALEFV